MRIDPGLIATAKAMARKLARRLPPSVMREDIEQAAMLGLIDGLRKHPDGSGPAWEWYIRCRIRGSMLDELRAQDWAARRRKGRGGGVPAKVLHLDDVSDCWADTFSAGGETPEDQAMRNHDAEKAWTTPLSDRDRRIMRWCHERGVLHKDIGNLEAISEARVSQRITSSLASMRSHLTGEAPAHVVPRKLRAGLWKSVPEAAALREESVPSTTAPGEGSLP